MDEVTRSDARLGDYVKKDHKDFDRRYHVNGMRTNKNYININVCRNRRDFCINIFSSLNRTIVCCRK